MPAVDQIVKLFGGQKQLADALGKRQSTVSYWVQTGNIPIKWRQSILLAAGQKGLTLGHQDFNEPVEPEVPAILDALPSAEWQGELKVMDDAVGCYVLGDGRRVISRKAVVDYLTENKGGGNLESYLDAASIQKYIPHNIQDQMVEFTIKGVSNKTVKGFLAEMFLEICNAYAQARDKNELTTPRQIEIAIKANMFLSSCAKIGLIALIDEATGYQYERAKDALQFKLKLYLEDEMRKWEKTFPDALWIEFKRLTNWAGPLSSRPKYWGKLVMELVYGYLDSDVRAWLKENAPKPQKGQNYHQWLSSQYGLKKLTEHLWMLIGMASSCNTMGELKELMAKKYGLEKFQISVYLPPLKKVLNPHTPLFTDEEIPGGKQAE